VAESVASQCDRDGKTASAPTGARRRFGGRWGAAALTCAALLLHAGSSLAQESPKAAREAYDEATEAFKQRDYEAAASLFGKADAIAPNPVALEQAIRAAVRADKPVIGMDLVRRALKREAEGTLLEAAEEGRAAFQDRVGKLQVSCKSCGVRIDEVAATPGRIQWVEVGWHLVEFGGAGEGERRMVQVHPRKTTRVSPKAEQPAGAAAPDPAAGDEPADIKPAGRPVDAKASSPEPSPSKSEPSAPAPRPAVDRGTGESPAWFWIGLGTTAAFGLATIGSAVDTGNRHDEYVKNPSPENGDAGQSAQTRTHALLGLTAATGVATALIGAVAVRWTDPTTKMTGALHPTQGGAAATLTGRF
jgi:hypothetical protein